MTGPILMAVLLSIPQPVAGPGSPDQSAAGEGRLYGRVTTTEGRRVEGYLRWDRNEAGRADFLDAEKEIRREILDQAVRLDPDFAAELRRRRSIVAFGVRLRWDEDDLEGPPTVPAAVRFGHIAAIEPGEDRHATLTLVDGQTVELLGSTSDLGPGLRDILVDTGVGEPVEIDWREIARVDLVDPPPEAPAPRARPIHGTVRTWDGVEMTGWIAWDRDEVLSSDVLDGREGSTEYEIPFVDIERIAPEGRRSAAVTLRSGEVLSLRGTNDVDRSNRGIEVSVPRWGRAVVEWENLEEVRFHPPASVVPERDGRLGPIRGTVYARDGRELRGAIRWGHDEEQLWELLDGWMGETRLEIEFGAIEQIRPDGEAASVVSLTDGRTLRLEGTEDVGRGHRGVYVETDAGTTRLVRWEDVERVLFLR